jgi:dienelactone hydrolase
MRLGIGPVLAIALVGCTVGGASPRSPSPSTSYVPATPAELSPYYGSYSTDSGDTLVIARMGWFLDMRTSAYRTIYVRRLPNQFTIGCRFREPVPECAVLELTQQTLSVRGTTAALITGHRLRYSETDVTIPASGAKLAGTITEPQVGAGRGGIVIVHGAEPGQRYFYDIWVGVYAALGLAILTYDKRGTGSSTGSYPGEFPSEDALKVYADDASAALDFLAGWPGIDPKRVGFHGGSQGGWTVPLAMSRHTGAAFAVLASAPATTVDQTDIWAGFSDGGATVPAESNEQMLMAVRAAHTGYDPAPALQALTVPILWLLGTNDRTVPTAICVQILSGMHKPNFMVELLPTGHGLLVNPTGLLADDTHSAGLAPGLILALQSWLRANSY